MCLSLALLMCGYLEFPVNPIRDQGHLYALTDSNRHPSGVDKFHSSGSSTIQNALGSSCVHLCDRKYQFLQCTNTQTAIFLCWPGFPGPCGLLVMLSWDYTGCGVYHAFNSFSLSFFSYCCKKMFWGKKQLRKEGFILAQSSRCGPSWQGSQGSGSMRKLTSLYLFTVSRKHREVNACAPLSFWTSCSSRSLPREWIPHN